MVPSSQLQTKAHPGQGTQQQTLPTLNWASKGLHTRGKHKPDEKFPPPSGSCKEVALAMAGGSQEMLTQSKSVLPGWLQ